MPIRPRPLAALRIQEAGGGSKMKLKDFEGKCATDSNLKQLKQEVVGFAKQFPFPGYENPFEGF